MLSALAQARRPDLAATVFESLKKAGFQISIFHYNAVMNAYSNRHEWVQALQLLGFMLQDTVEVNTITYNAAISACEKGGEWVKALGLLSAMVQDKVEGDTTT